MVVVVVVLLCFWYDWVCISASPVDELSDWLIKWLKAGLVD